MTPREQGRSPASSGEPTDPVIPRLSCVIAGTPFGGSGLLADALAATGAVPLARRYFSPQLVQRFARAWGQPVHGSSFFDWYLNEAVARSTDDEGVCAVRLDSDDLRSLLQLLPTLPHVLHAGETDLVACWFAHPTYVVVEREDSDLQAVEWFREQHPARSRALLSGEMSAGRAEAALREIRWLEAVLAAQGARWEAHLATVGRPPVVVDFADLVERPDGVVSRVLAAVGFPPPRRTDRAGDASAPPESPAVSGSADPDEWPEWPGPLVERLLDLYSEARDRLPDLPGARGPRA